MPSNVLYPTFKEALLKGSIDLDSSTVYVTLVSSSYTYSATDEFYSTSITAYQVGNTGTLINKSFTTGTLSGSAITFPLVAEGDTVEHVIVFQSGTVGVSDYVVAHYDTGTIGGINITTNGSDIEVLWNSSGLFSL